jgi:Putative zinc-finger
MNEACEQTRELLPELALGILGGEDCARALDHLTICSDCSNELATLSRAADGLLTLAPQHEPPAGFEDRVMTRLRRERPQHRARRFMTFAAAAALIAIVAGGAVWVGTANDRKLGSYYQRILAIEHGTELAAARLETTDGLPAGEAFTYQGKPSWLFVVVTAPVGDGVYDIFGTVNGTPVRLGVIRVAHGRGDWGGTTTTEMKSVSEIRVVDRTGQLVLHGTVRHN